MVDVLGLMVHTGDATCTTGAFPQQPGMEGGAILAASFPPLLEYHFGCQQHMPDSRMPSTLPLGESPLLTVKMAYTSSQRL